MEKKQALDKLYALRAGLSVISQEYDKAQAIDNECGEKLVKNAEDFCGDMIFTGNYPELKQLKEKYGYEDLSKEEIEHIQNYFSSMFIDKQIEQQTYAKNQSVSDKVFGHWLAFDESTEYFEKKLVAAQNKKDSVAAGNDTRTYGFSYKGESKRYKGLSILFFILTAIALVPPILFTALTTITTGVLVFFSLIPAVFLILGIVFICKAKRYKLQHMGEVNKKSNEVQEAQLMLDKLPEVRSKARAILKQKDEKIAPIKESCNEFYMALKKQFNPVLDERDWQNLDLVIYELETRRADSIKEALQLVDRELQTERIQQTIVQATEQICYEIRRGFAEMRETIIECSRVISAQLSAISMQLADMGGQLADLCDSVNMSNALQAKANVTSAQLLSDVHAIRYYN